MLKKLTKNIEKTCTGSCSLCYWFEKYYQNIVDNEIRLANIHQSEILLCVGGGSIPCTAIAMAKKTGCHVDVVDIDQDAVEKGKTLIKKMGLENQIHFYVADGRSLDVDKYHIIHIALQIHPRMDVFHNIWEKAKIGTKILMRAPKGKDLLFNQFFMKWNNKKVIKQKSITMKETIMVIKNEEKTHHQNIFHDKWTGLVHTDTA